MDKTIVGMSLVNINDGVFENGMWKVNVKLTESRTYSDGTRDEETIEAMCMDTDHLNAHDVAMKTALYQLRQEVYDKGLTSLVEARNKYGRPVYGSLADKDTPTQ